VQENKQVALTALVIMERKGKKEGFGPIPVDFIFRSHFSNPAFQSHRALGTQALHI
jgi:hypothetical protein